MNDYNMQSMEFDTNIMKDIEKQRIIDQLEDGVVEYNRKFLEHPSNRILSKHIIYSKDKSPEDNVEEIISLLK